MPKPIAVPEAVKRAQHASELLRAWATSEGQVFSVRVEHWEDPAAWGLLLADLARHIAESYGAAGLRPKEYALERLLAGLRVELEE